MANVIDRRDIISIGGSLIALGALPVELVQAAAAKSAVLDRVQPWTSENRFMGQAFAPVFDERDDIDLVIEGALPGGLDGTFMRIGPNPRFAPDDHYAYPFDGTGMVHAIHLRNGKASYANRWVATREMLEERAAGRRLYNSSFSPPPHANLANTNVIRHGGRILALFEAGVPYELDRNLGTIGPYDYDGKLPAVMSAHPKIDPATGELLAIAYHWQAGTLTYLRADKAGRLDRAVPFQAPWPAMIHDIAITERHVVAFMGPAIFDPSKPGPPVTWQPERGSAVAIVPREARHAEDVKWIKGSPFFNFHVMNAFVEGNRIEVVLPWYDSFSLGKPASRLELHRLVLNMDRATMEDSILDDRACEFPRINDALLGRSARYGYVGLRDPRPGETPQVGAFEAIARYDLRTGTKTVHRFPSGVTICEPVFVRDPYGKDEADGFVFTFAHEAGSAEGRFFILDARNLEAEPVAAIRLPRRVPAGLHGSWMAA